MYLGFDSLILIKLQNAPDSHEIRKSLVEFPQVDSFRAIINKHLELIFVVVLLLATGFTYHFVDQKLAFLHFYYLPVIFAGYYFGARFSVMNAVLACLLVSAYVMFDANEFRSRLSLQDLYMHVALWGAFMILAGYFVGQQKDKIKEKIVSIEKMNHLLHTQQDQLRSNHESLQNYSSNLEAMVSERTLELERSNHAIASLKTKVENALYSTMDSSVVKLIIEGRLHTEKKNVSVMFADLENFTGHSEDLSPEIVVRDLNKYLASMEPIINDYHGHLDKFLGDGIMVEFGAPIDFASYRVQAVLAGSIMQKRMQRLNLPWKMRVGIASGQSILGLIGSKRQSYTAIGDVVNLASRLEKACPAGGVLIDDETHEGVKRFVDTVPFVNFDLSVNGQDTFSVEEEIHRLKSEAESLEGVDLKAQISQKIGNLYMSLGQQKMASGFYESAVRMRPEVVEYKIALADAVVNQNSLWVKGRKKPVKAHLVTGLKDPLMDTTRFSKTFYDQYSQIFNRMNLMDDLVIKGEVLDGTLGHARVVAALSFAMSERISEYDSERMEIFEAAYYADIGKDVVAQDILNRNGSLTLTEMVEIHKHPAESIRLLKTSGFRKESVFSLISYSHERFDGKGYPGELSEKRIPLGSRVIAVADAFDAMTSWRPYREAWSWQSAIDEMRGASKSGQFDPEVVETLVAVLDKIKK